MKENRKQPGIIGSIFIGLFCYGLQYWPLGVVTKTWWALIFFLPFHGWHATFPNYYAGLLFALLIALTVMLFRVNRLIEDVQGHTGKLIAERVAAYLPLA